MTRSSCGPWLLCCLVLPACSAIVRELPVSCESDDDCRALNKAKGREQSCITYQCRADGRGCELQPRDQDRDQAPDAVSCGDAGLSNLDCDDENDARVPEAEERCDGIDNDCDQTIDEGALIEAELASRMRIDVPAVLGLSSAQPSPGQVLVAVTSRAGTRYRTTLHGWPHQLDVALQTELNELTCRDRLRHCSLAEVAIAASSDALLLLGIEGTGDQTGRVRFAPLQDWSALAGSVPALWDGSSAAKSASNLKCGVDDPNCEAPEPQSGSGASLALFAPPRQNGEGMGLWRAGAGAPAALVGLSFALGVRGGALQVDANDGPSSRSLSGTDPDRLGSDPAAIRVWQHAEEVSYFVAFDSLRGVELAYVDQLNDGAARAFAAARTRWLPQPGVRHVDLALDTDNESEPRLGLAWRAPDEDRWSIYFTELSFALRGGFTDPPERLLVAGRRPIVDGPVIAYAAHGFNVAPETSTGGWFLLWVEAGDASEGQLVAARVSGTSGARLGEPFVIYRGQVSYPFAFASSESTVGYGFVSTSGSAQLNIGSLACRSE